MSGLAPPRELVPCFLRKAQFDGRIASWHDQVSCAIKACSAPARWLVSAGISVRPEANHVQSEVLRDTTVYLFTDDEAEAEVAWLRAEAWVRTGELS